MPSSSNNTNVCLNTPSIAHRVPIVNKRKKSSLNISIIKNNNISIILEPIVPKERRSAFNKCNVNIVDVLHQQNRDYVVPSKIEYPDEEGDDVGNNNNDSDSTAVYYNINFNDNDNSNDDIFVFTFSKKKRNSDNKFNFLLFTLTFEKPLMVYDPDSDAGLFSLDNTPENNTRASEEDFTN
jgi:hypothetical protein